MQVKQNNWGSRFVEWYYSLPSWKALPLLPLVLALGVAAMVVNYMRGVKS